MPPVCWHWPCSPPFDSQIEKCDKGNSVRGKKAIRLGDQTSREFDRPHTMPARAALACCLLPLSARHAPGILSPAKGFILLVFMRFSHHFCH